MLTALLKHWNRKQAASISTLGPVASTRLASRSANRPAGDSIWQGLMRLLPGEADPWQGRGANGGHGAMASARQRFAACLDDLQGDGVEELLRSIRRSRTLADLWHLRTWLYTEIARAHSQWEAEQRLAPLNAHFVSLARGAARRH
ncbi:hypothetical protein [Roseateles violae]|uniref:Uncharacterized protein n=1 Tax=Roseateles violae TaxID=3058042 RepID=A0ABT8DY07_9BURK|nr:hypothetical protein [Pelomonas sp. PFR6]MDN3921781.1 hypothetical protein [Pelomonas sp. PFR6]